MEAGGVFCVLGRLRRTRGCIFSYKHNLLCLCASGRLLYWGSMEMCVRTHSEEETRRLGCRIGERLVGGEVIALFGELGTGKTVLTQGIARGAGVPESVYVTSQTFTLMRSYPGRVLVHHIDLYRLSGPEEALLRGVDEVLGDPDGVAVIEWAERAELPEARLDVILTHVSPEEREVEVIPHGSGAERLCEGLCSC